MASPARPKNDTPSWRSLSDDCHLMSMMSAVGEPDAFTGKVPAIWQVGQASMRSSSMCISRMARSR